MKWDWTIEQSSNIHQGIQKLSCVKPFNDIVVFSFDLTKDNIEKEIKKLTEKFSFGVYFLINTMKKPKPWIYIGQTEDDIKTRYKYHLKNKPEVEKCNILIGVYFLFEKYWTKTAVENLETIYIKKFKKLGFWEVDNIINGKLKPSYPNQEENIEFINTAFSYFQIISLFQDKEKAQTSVFPDFKPNLQFEDSLQTSTVKQQSKKTKTKPSEIQKQTMPSEEQEVFIRTRDNKLISGILINHNPKNIITIPAGTSYKTKVTILKSSDREEILNIFRNLFKVGFITSPTLNESSPDELFSDYFEVTFQKDWKEQSVSRAAKAIKANMCSGNACWYTKENKFLNGKILSNKIIELIPIHLPRMKYEQNNKANVKVFFQEHTQKCLIKKGTFFWTKVYKWETSYKDYIIKLWKKLVERGYIKNDFSEIGLKDDICYQDIFKITFLNNYEAKPSTCAEIILGKTSNGWNEWKDKNDNSIQKYRINKK